ncbi:Gtpase hflx [Thalictrum thalictroides]|uniref:Gtpase hflx n=1 Tax=Thalictrum thalictroides TaxID=46969 RepID=A0A7J6VUH8_THATH|nr:Gtpase hflx [Thalictrum thalictroides]
MLMRTTDVIRASISRSLTGILSNTLPSSLRFSHSSTKHKTDEVYDNNFIYNKDPEKPPKLFVVQPRFRSDTTLKAKLSEALNLANSLEEQRDGFFICDMSDKKLPPHVIVQNPLQRSVKGHSDTFFGPGTVETIKCHLSAEDSKDELDAVFVNSILSGVQQRNLERLWGKPVLDRVGLIIEIFNAHALTKEAKLQSELAALMYKKTRLVRVRGPGGKLSFGASGEAEVVSARGRGSGGRGFISGAGETELQLQRRRILERRSHLLSEIEEVRRTRALQRASRRRRGGSEGQGLPTVAIVGYTNAGKSTLVSALSETDLYSDDRLFATVDTRTRSVILPSGRKVLLSDTVGFISDLPVQLVEAFHATLEEVAEADLLVHVMDSSAINLEDQRSSVLEVLQQIGVSEEKLQNMIEVWNKIDLRDQQNGVDDFVNGAEDECDFTETENGTESDSFLEESIDEDDSVTGLLPEQSAENADEGENDALEDGKAVKDQWDDWNVVDDLQDDSFKILKTDEDSQGEFRDNLVVNADSQRLKTDEDSEGEVRDNLVVNADSLSQDVQPVETSAVMGVGLQELLNLIDEKLNKQNVVERSFDSFNRKWRPPRNVEADTAVAN